MIHTIWECQTVQEGLDHPECLNFGRDGRLYAGGELGQIYRVDLGKPQGSRLEELARTDGLVAGVVADGLDNVYACDIRKHAVFKVSSEGEVTTFCSSVGGRPLILPNYALFSDDGSLYFTDSGDYWNANGRLIRVRPDGVAESLLSESLYCPNGIALSAAGDRIFMIETTAAHIVSLPIHGDGSVGRAEIFVQLQGTIPDGLAIDAQGNLYVACYKPDLIFRVDPKRNVSVLIEDSTGDVLNRPTNVAFRPDGDTRLYFSNFGGWSIGSLDVGVRGVPLRYPEI